MSVIRIREMAVLAATLLLVSACGGNTPVARSCNEHTVYKNAREHERVKAPDGLTALDPEDEMVLPEPSPQAPRAEDAPCLDLPPSVLGSDEGAEEEDDFDEDATK
jgi:uncharacterized lipoprotein